VPRSSPGQLGKLFRHDRETGTTHNLAHRTSLVFRTKKAQPRTQNFLSFQNEKGHCHDTLFTARTLCCMLFYHHHHDERPCRYRDLSSSGITALSPKVFEGMSGLNSWLSVCTQCVSQASWLWDCKSLIHPHLTTHSHSRRLHGNQLGDPSVPESFRLLDGVFDDCNSIFGL